MRVTLRNWVGGAVLLASGFSAGWLMAHKNQRPFESKNNLVSLNDEAEILKVDGQIIRLRDLNSAAQFGLHRLTEQIVLQAQRYAEDHATRASLKATADSPAEWRQIYSDQISVEKLRRVYDENSSLRQSGEFSEVWPDVERFVIDREKTRQIGLFLETRFQDKKLVFLENQPPAPELPFDVSDYPSIVIGDEFKQTAPEVVVLFRYGGRLSNSMFKLLTDLSRDNKRRIVVRLVPEFSLSEYDRVAVTALFQAQRSFSSDPQKLRAVHTLLLDEPLVQSVAQLATPKAVISHISGKLAQLGLSLPQTAQAPQNFEIISAWARDVRVNRLPMIFVDKRWVSETHPRGLPDALRVAVGINSLIAGQD